MSLLSEVSFPLGLVLVWDNAIGLVAKDDPGWAESVERVKSVARALVNWSVLRVHWGPRLLVTSLLDVWTASCVCLMALGW